MRPEPAMPQFLARRRHSSPPCAAVYRVPAAIAEAGFRRWLGPAREAEVGYFGKYEIHTVTVGTCLARRIRGGVARLRRRISYTLPIWAASLSCLDSDCLYRNAVHLCGMGRQAHRVRFCTAWRADWPRRRADLHLYIVGSTATAAV